MSPLILLAQLCVIALLAVGTNGDSRDEHSDEFLRARLGHFHKMEDPKYLEIYEQYFKKVLKKRDKSFESTNVNQWVNVRPTAHTCLDYLQYFRVKKYTLQKPFDIILLDACLDWLYDQSEEKKFDVDQLGKTSTVRLTNLAADQTFEKIFTSTKFKTDSLPRTLTDNVYAYLMRLLDVHASNPANGCHSLWMDAYNDFIEQVYIGDCETEEGCNFYGMEHSDDDSYLRLIAKSTMEATASCYNVMQKQIPALWKESRKAEDQSTIKGKVIAALGKLMGQTEQSILQLVSGGDPNKSVDLAQVADDLRLIKNMDDKAIKRMTDALANYVKHNADIGSTSGDAYGRVRYGRALTKLCRSYTDPNFFLAATGGAAVDEDPEVVKKPFDFYHLIYSLVRVTNHEPVYGLSKDQFENDVMSHKWVPLYLATLACQIIATSVGSLNFDSNEGNFEVELDLAARVLYADWPISAIVSKLKPDPDSRKKTFSLFNLHKGAESDSTDDANDEPKSVERVVRYPIQPVYEQTTTSEPIDTPVRTRSLTSGKSGERVRYSSPVLDENGHVLYAPIPLPKISEESIKMFIIMHGKYPSELPANIDKYYTWMPALLNQVRRKRLNDLLSMVKSKPQKNLIAQQLTEPMSDSVQSEQPKQRKFVKVSKKGNLKRRRNSPLMGRKRTPSFNGSEMNGFDLNSAARLPAESFAPIPYNMPQTGSSTTYSLPLAPVDAPAPFRFGSGNQPTLQQQQQQQQASTYGTLNNLAQQQTPAFVFGANNNQANRQQQQQQNAFVTRTSNNQHQPWPAANGHSVTRFEPPNGGFAMGSSAQGAENVFSLANTPESSVFPSGSMHYGTPVNNNPFARGPSSSELHQSNGNRFNGLNQSFWSGNQLGGSQTSASNFNGFNSRL